MLSKLHVSKIGLAPPSADEGITFAYTADGTTYTILARVQANIDRPHKLNVLMDGVYVWSSVLTDEDQTAYRTIQELLCDLKEEKERSIRAKAREWNIDREV